VNDLDEWIEHTATLIGQSRALIEQGRRRLEEDARWLQSIGVDTQSLKDEVASCISDADRLRFESLQAADPVLTAAPAPTLHRKVLRSLV
jgi:hypothetical protein